jgi:HK97 family phage major capsid protein
MSKKQLKYTLNLQTFAERTLRDIRAELAAKKDEIRQMLDKATTEKRGFTKEEDDSYLVLENEVEALEAEIVREERSERFKMEAGTGSPKTPEDPNHETEFRSLGEFVSTVRFDPTDSRLKQYRDMTLGNKSTGGIFVPQQLSKEMFRLATEAAIVRPRARVIPADGQYPDASIQWPILDQQSETSNMYGGVEVQWIEEGAEKPRTDANFTDFTLQPHEVAGTIEVTDKLLRNVSGMNTLLNSLLSQAILHAEDNAFLYGDGLGKPDGVNLSPAVITVPRATAGQITYTDVVKMLAKAKLSSDLIWVASQSTLVQLLTMTDPSGRYIYQANANDATKGTLLGYPIRWTERGPLSGTAGDLMLLDLGYYIIKDGSGIFIEASSHVKFTSNRTIIKAFWNVDGGPWIKAPLKLENGDTVSPFVKLGVPTP